MIDEFGDCAGMPDTYRGLWISYKPPFAPAIPRCGDWVAISPDFCGGAAPSGAALNAATREELIAKIDAWILEN